jgi:hypothetical protein
MPPSIYSGMSNIDPEWNGIIYAMPFQNLGLGPFKKKKNVLTFSYKLNGI